MDIADDGQINHAESTRRKLVDRDHAGDDGNSISVEPENVQGSAPQHSTEPEPDRDVRALAWGDAPTLRLDGAFFPLCRSVELSFRTAKSGYRNEALSRRSRSNRSDSRCSFGVTLR